jgi:hypothetical protein
MNAARVQQDKQNMYYVLAAILQQNQISRWPAQPTTTMRILSFGAFDGCTQGGADAAEWLKST